MNGAADQWAIVRRVAVVAYFGVLLVQIYARGLPIGTTTIFPWIIAGLACACIGKPRKQILWLLIDWVPFCLVLIGYNYSRGWADGAGFSVHYEPQLKVDEWLFFGHVPTEWLQEHLFTTETTVRNGRLIRRLGGPVQWYEYIFAITYVSHYITSFTLAGVLWVRNRKRFQAFARRFVTISYLGFVTYALFPAAPPWLAAEDGYLSSDVWRMPRRALSNIGLDFVRGAIDRGARVTNFVAAVPSLHEAFTVLVVITLWRSVPKWARPLLALYPFLMGFGLVATGEHYVSDLLLGVVYAFLACWLWDRIERWWEDRKSGDSPLAVEAVDVGPDSPTLRDQLPEMGVR